MSQPVETDAELLLALVEGRIDEGEARVQELFRRKPELRTLAAACRDVEGALDLAALRAAASEDDRRLTAESLSAARHGPAYAAPPRKEPRAQETRARRVRLLAAAAVIAAAVFVVLRLARNAETPTPRLLGEPDALDGLDCVKPVGTTADLLTFEWNLAERLESRGDFLLTVWREAQDGTLGERILQQTTTKEEWEVPPESAAGWPERIHWRVEACDESGVVAFSCESSALRSP